MDIIFIGKLFLFYVLPAIIVFCLEIYCHFDDETKELSILDLFGYLLLAIVPGLNIGIILLILIAVSGTMIYRKLDGFIIYRKK